MAYPIRITNALPTLAAVCGCLVIASPAAGAGTQTLTASFNSDGSMHLVLSDGTPVGTPSPPGTAILPGPYLVVVNNNDASDNFGPTHDFHLTGPGVNAEAVLTQAEETQATWTVTFQTNGTYTFQDDYRPALIHLVFRASTSAPTPAATPTTPPPSTSASGGSKTSGTVAKNPSVVGSALAPATPRGTLTASVGSTGALRLASNGKSVTSLHAGRYRLVVTDQSPTRGFTIQEIKKPPQTISGGAFTGTRSLTLNLRAGQWFFYSTFVGKKTYFIVTA